jgi:hypothetical protein
MHRVVANDISICLHRADALWPLKGFRAFREPGRMHLMGGHYFQKAQGQIFRTIRIHGQGHLMFAGVSQSDLDWRDRLDPWWSIAGRGWGG